MTSTAKTHEYVSHVTEWVDSVYWNTHIRLTKRSTNGPTASSVHACAGAVLLSSSALLSECFCCMLRTKICCSADDTTDTAAIIAP